MEINQVVFWQPIISPHYSTLFVALTRFYKVTVYFENEMPQDRKKQGWVLPLLPGVYVAKVDSKESIKQFEEINSDQTLHIFSGTRGYKLIWTVFKHAMNRNANCGFLGESLDWLGLNGKIRYIVSSVDRFLYQSKMKFILGNGELGVKWYEKVGYNTAKIFEWAYFVEEPKIRTIHVNSSGIVRFAFVGRISKEKGLDWLVSSLLRLSDSSFELNIIGDGPELDYIESLIPIEMRSKFIFQGRRNQSEIYSLLQVMDYLILPSTGKDGWGAVINEAFNVGLPCIVSSYAGASCLILNKKLGFIIDPQNRAGLIETLNLILKEKLIPDEERKDLIMNFSSCISGEAGAKYLKSIIDYISMITKIKPIAPWRTFFLN